MEIKCMCGSECIKDTSLIPKKLDLFYRPCAKCKGVNFKKFSPLTTQIDIAKIDNSFGSCECGKRHLDAVIAHILKIMIEEGIKDEKSTLRDTCVPLITPAYPIHSIPFLPPDSLVILSEEINEKCAQRIVKEVSEVKGVLKGNIRETVGIKDAESNPYIYELLAGCDMRCDIVDTPYGAIIINKNQGKIHIEFPKLKSPKIEILMNALEEFNEPSVLDFTCGPGTLGIACLKAGARKVVFNDLWQPAVEMTVINLEANGFSAVHSGNKEGLVAYGDKFEVYCSDIKKLKYFTDEKFDICIVDVFPGVNADEFLQAGSELAKKVLLI
jgi:hypothetical protein